VTRKTPAKNYNIVRSRGEKNRRGRTSPATIAAPPMRDTAFLCTFRSLGRSIVFRRTEYRITTGVSHRERSKAGKKINAR
jgi:hypothetical protein